MVPTKIWKSTLDCADIEVTTTFWAWLLGVIVISEDGNYRNLGPTGGSPVLGLQKVAEPPSGKNRMHLDLLVEDLDTVVEEVSRHGGKRLSDLNQVPAGRWYVMADPEGNEFCLVSLAPED